MLRFLADMGVSLRIVHELREQGHDVVHLREEGLQRLPDPEIFAKAVAEQRVILTFDLDFGEIVALTSGQVISVVLFRVNNTASSFLIQRLGVVLPSIESSLRDGAIVVVEDGRHRVRRLPLGR